MDPLPSVSVHYVLHVVPAQVMLCLEIGEELMQLSASEIRGRREGGERRGASRGRRRRRGRGSGRDRRRITMGQRMSA